MGEPRFLRQITAVGDPSQSGERPAAPRATHLSRARVMNDNWDDRYGLLPPEPPRPAHRHDSVLLALSDLEGLPLPRYGTLPSINTAALLDAELKQRLNLGLSIVAGYVDAAGFVALFGFFPAHLTGELVSVAATPWTTHKPLAHNGVVLASLFLLGVLVSVLLARKLSKRGQTPYIPQLLLLTGTLAGLASMGILHASGLQIEQFASLAAGCAVFAMGVQNAVMRHALSGTLPTTVMTGNLTQFITELVDLGLSRVTRHPDPEKTHQTVHRLRILGRTLLAFFGGAGVGAFASYKFGLTSITLPMLVGMSLTFIAWRATQGVEQIAESQS